MAIDFLSDPIVRAGAGLLVIGLMAATGFFLVARLRDYTTQDREEPPGMLANFEEMHREGDITEEEFRTIQSATQDQVRDPVSNSDSPPKHGESDVE